MNTKIYTERSFGRIMSPHMLLPLAIAGILIIISSSWLEYRSRRDDYLNLLRNRASIFIETLVNSSGYAFTAAAEIETEINKNINSSLNLIERLDRASAISGSDYAEILAESGFNGIQIYNNDLQIQRKFYSEAQIPVFVPEDILLTIVRTGGSRTLYVIPDTTDYEDEYLAAFVMRRNGGIIAGIINSEKIQYFRRVFGFGQLLKSYSEGEGIKYIVLENENTIIAGFFQGYDLTTFSEDAFLRNAYQKEITGSRVVEYPVEAVFEAVATYRYENELIGMLRMGISMSELEAITERAKRRMFIFSGLLVVVGLVLLNFVLSYRHRQLLRKELSFMNKYTNMILDNLESGVISVDENGKIKIVNRQASRFIGEEYVDLYDRKYSVFPKKFANAINNCINKNPNPKELQSCSLPGENESRWLALRTMHLTSEEDKDTYILLVDDMTEQVHLEDQIRRNEKLAAVKRLASGVAHEIRNPLNSINLIIDLLKSDYRPVENIEKYDKYITTVQKEILRISAIVEEFLKFARPPRLQPAPIDFVEFFSEIEILFRPRLEQNGLVLSLETESHPDYRGDRGQLKQVFINLLENSIHACKTGGEITITGYADNHEYLIILKDNGSGISEFNLNHIFDLYYTTKKRGSGVGLAIVHQIITRHNGTIQVESEECKETTFTISLPLDTVLSETI